MMILESKDDVANIKYIDARSFDLFYERIKNEITFPAEILSIGLKMNGFPFAFIKLGDPRHRQAQPGPVDLNVPVVKEEPMRRSGRKKSLAEANDEYTIKSTDEYEGEANSL